MNAETVIRSELESGETLLWHGQPRQGFVWRGADWFFVAFAAVWLAMTVYMGYGMLTNDEEVGLVAALVVVLFFLIGLYLVPGKFVIDARARRRTFYGVTDRRAIIVSGLSSTTVNSLLAKTLSDVSVEQRRDGSGTIYFGPKNPQDAMFGGLPWPGYQRTPQFEMIPDVRQVHRLLLRDG